jgi:Protein of unknown function (DUF1236)
MRPIGTIAAGLVLVSGTAVAQAQTAVTRQITSEPVETVVTQGPNGTVVTRRILSPEPGMSTYAAPPLDYGPVATETVEQQYVAPAPRRVTTSRTTAPVRTRTVTSRQATPARTETRVTRTVVAPPPPDEPLVLSPAQRQVIYRTVVREVYPARVPAVPPLVIGPPQADVYAPPPPAGYPLRTVYPPDAVFGDYAYDPYHDQYRPRDPYRDRAAYRWDGAPLMVGARIPQSVPLVAVPEPVAARIPAARPYSYAVLDNRVYLVDPATGVIVAEITP